MNTEYEATFPNINKDQIRSKLKQVGAKLVRPEFMQKRVVFITFENKQGEWIRVRDEADKITMTYKYIPWGDKNKIDEQKEVELEIDNFDEAVLFLKSVGCEKKSYQETKREIWELDDTEICIDTWPYLEPLLEIEAPTEELVKKAAAKLNLDYSKAKFCATDQIYHEKYNIPLDQINNHTPIITFKDPNPFI